MAGELRRRAPSDAIIARLHNGEVPLAPHNLDIEQAVLGTMIMHNSAYTKVADLLTADCFFEPMHQRVYTVAAGLIAEGQEATPLTLKTYFPEEFTGNDGVRPVQYLANLAVNAAQPHQLRGYAMLLLDLANKRRLIGLGSEVIQRAYSLEPSDTAKAILEETEEGLSQLNVNPGEVTGFVSFRTSATLASKAANGAYQRGGKLIGLSTGLPRLDALTGGLQAPDLIILAARPGMGKTALSTNIGYRVAEQAMERGGRRGGVGIFSLEMSDEQLAARIISEQSGVEGWKVRRGLASESEIERYILKARELERLPLYIDHTGGISISTLRTRARQLVKRHAVDLIIVDYLQLVTAPGRGENRTQEVTAVSSGLKAMAKELNVPVIALSQLSRDLEKRDDKRPMDSDLRESGSIEQDADNILFLYRDEQYLKRREPPKHDMDAHYDWEVAMAKVAGICEVHMTKNRHGPTGTVELGFQPRVMRFLNEPEERDPPPDRPAKPEGAKPAKEPNSRRKIMLNALGMLHDVLREIGVQNVKGRTEGVAKGATYAPYQEWRKRVLAQQLDETASDTAQTNHMKMVVGDLQFEGLIVRGGEQAEWIWLSDRGMRALPK
jgi:replicative DNA helicase